MVVALHKYFFSNYFFIEYSLWYTYNNSRPYNDPVIPWTSDKGLFRRDYGL